MFTTLLKTYIIPLFAAIICFFLAVGIVDWLLSFLVMDDLIKGSIKLIAWVLSFTIPFSYLRNKAMKDTLGSK